VRALLAQIGAEVRMRMRSAATLIAVLAFVAGAFFWIPDPHGTATSLSWELPDGRVQAPLYTAEYVGFAISILSGIFLALGGFYLVAGSVRRDRERNVGAILAATPLSKTAYLGGKFAAHFVYLLLLAALGLAAGLAAFLRFGIGPFSLADFSLPYFASIIPAVAVVASLAILFDVTPLLRGRGGLVIWFFFFVFVLIKLPLDLSGADVDGGGRTAPPGSPRDGPGGDDPKVLPIYDPSGLATHQWHVRQSLPEKVKGVSTGYVFHSKPFERVEWHGAPLTAKQIVFRALNLALAVVPLSLAILLFDRFDPAARFRPRRGKKKRTKAEQAVVAEDASRRERPAVHLTPIHARPGAVTAVFAEARLIWESATWIKWPLALAAILAGLLPGNLPAGIFLVLLVPVISEAAAREEMAGTRALVFSQPGVPASLVLWKTASLTLVVTMLGAPMVVRGFVDSLAKGIAGVVGLLAISALCVGLGSLSSGGKLFTGLYVACWYAAMSGGAEMDITGALGKSPQPLLSLAYLGGGVLLVALAATREKMRA
jgi:hypothetical protein